MVWHRYSRNKDHCNAKNIVAFIDRISTRQIKRGGRASHWSGDSDETLCRLLPTTPTCLNPSFTEFNGASFQCKQENTRTYPITHAGSSCSGEPSVPATKSLIHSRADATPPLQAPLLPCRQINTTTILFLLTNTSEVARLITNSKKQCVPADIAPI